MLSNGNTRVENIYFGQMVPWWQPAVFNGGWLWVVGSAYSHCLLRQLDIYEPKKLRSLMTFDWRPHRRIDVSITHSSLCSLWVLLCLSSICPFNFSCAILNNHGGTGLMIHPSLYGDFPALTLSVYNMSLLNLSMVESLSPSTNLLHTIHTNTLAKPPGFWCRLTPSQ